MSISKEKLFYRACNYLSRRIRTEKEIKEYLVKTFSLNESHADILNQTLANLKSYSYINDREYIALYVRSVLNRKAKSTNLLKHDLLKKGVDKDLVEQFFLEHSISNEDLALKTLNKVWYRYKDLDFLKKKKRVTDYLLRRGFSFDQALKSLETVEKQSNIEKKRL